MKSGFANQTWQQVEETRKSKADEKTAKKYRPGIEGGSAIHFVKNLTTGVGQKGFGDDGGFGQENYFRISFVVVQHRWWMILIKKKLIVLNYKKL